MLTESTTAAAAGSKRWNRVHIRSHGSRHGRTLRELYEKVVPDGVWAMSSSSFIFRGYFKEESTSSGHYGVNHTAKGALFIRRHENKFQAENSHDLNFNYSPQLKLSSSSCAVVV